MTLDLCYYLGDDVLDSHVPYFPWYDGTPESYKTYVNMLTLEARKIISEAKIYIISLFIGRLKTVAKSTMYRSRSRSRG